MTRFAAIVTIAFAVAACAAPSEPLQAPDVTTAPAPTTTVGAVDTTIGLEAPIDSSPSVNPNLAPVAIAARVDLASRLGVAEDDIAVTSLAVVNWHDGSIGCPEEGMSYTQALVPGTRVTLEHDGKEYAYHKAADGAVFLCENPATWSYDIAKEGNEDLELTPPPGYDE